MYDSIFCEEETMEEKEKQLAKMIADYSIDVQPQEVVLIDYETTAPISLVKALIHEIIQKGGVPITNMTNPEVAAYLLQNSNDDRIKIVKKYKEFEVSMVDAYIHIRCSLNDYETKNVPKETIRKMGAALQKSKDERVNHRKWVLLNYPSVLDAYKAHMPIEEFKNFAMDVMTVDYSAMSEKIKPLKELMEKTNKVRIVSPNTDLTFSIKGLPAVPCTGEKNIPDGELYTAPVKESVNGRITYNTPCPYQGFVFHNVSLKFENGKIVEATCNEDNEELNKIFDQDEGARYVGEFSLGFNPKLSSPMGDILFDEKIFGSLHFTPGACYEDCDNGNRSAVHWDMVLIQTAEYGGGEIYFDDVLIRKDGLFVLEDLKPLNFGKE